jgi:hypothetical protein
MVAMLAGAGAKEIHIAVAHANMPMDPGERQEAMRKLIAAAEQGVREHLLAMLERMEQDHLASLKEYQGLNTEPPVKEFHSQKLLDEMRAGKWPELNVPPVHLHLLNTQPVGAIPDDLAGKVHVISPAEAIRVAANLPSSEGVLAP